MSYNFTPFPKLETKRLLLRAITINDVHSILALRTNKEINTYITRKITKDAKDAANFVKMIETLIAKNEGILWGIELKQTHQLIGTIGLRNFNIEVNYAEIGYELLPKFQQKGIMSEALTSCLDYAFSKLNIKNIEAFTHKNNLASIALLKKHIFVLQSEKRDIGFENNRIYRLNSTEHFKKTTI